MSFDVKDLYNNDYEVTEDVMIQLRNQVFQDQERSQVIASHLNRLHNQIDDMNGRGEHVLPHEVVDMIIRRLYHDKLPNEELPPSVYPLRKVKRSGEHIIISYEEKKKRKSEVMDIEMFSTLYNVENFINVFDIEFKEFIIPKLTDVIDYNSIIEELRQQLNTLNVELNTKDTLLNLSNREKEDILRSAQLANNKITELSQQLNESSEEAQKKLEEAENASANSIKKLTDKLVDENSNIKKEVDDLKKRIMDLQKSINDKPINVTVKSDSKNDRLKKGLTDKPQEKDTDISGKGIGTVTNRDLDNVQPGDKIKIVDRSTSVKDLKNSKIKIDKVDVDILDNENPLINSKIGNQLDLNSTSTSNITIKSNSNNKTLQTINEIDEEIERLNEELEKSKKGGLKYKLIQERLDVLINKRKELKGDEEDNEEVIIIEEDEDEIKKFIDEGRNDKDTNSSIEVIDDFEDKFGNRWIITIDNTGEVRVTRNGVEQDPKGLEGKTLNSPTSGKDFDSLEHKFSLQTYIKQGENPRKRLKVQTIKITKGSRRR